MPAVPRWPTCRLMISTSAPVFSRTASYSGNPRNICGWKVQLAEHALKTRRVVRIALVWSGRFTQVVAQRRHRRAFEGMGEYRLRTVVLEPRSRVEPFQFLVSERDEHAIGSSPGGRKERGALTDA